MIASVWQTPELHVNASEGFKRTGITVALDGTEDLEIVKEAGEFWKICLEKVAPAVAELCIARGAWTCSTV